MDFSSLEHRQATFHKGELRILKLLSEVGGTTVYVCIHDCTATSKDSGWLLLSSIKHFRNISNVVQVPFINL